MSLDNPASVAKNFYIIDGKEFFAPNLQSGLYITGTPIGNLGDITLRALSTLSAADAILCEDTRITRKLLNRYGIENVLHAYHDHNGAQMRPRVLNWLENNKSIALVSDAGMPLVSDPGYKLAREVRDHGYNLQVVPGVSAPLTGLALSGLPSDRFLFAGFLPAKKQLRLATLAELGASNATLIFFESVKRIDRTIAEIDEVLGDRQIALTRELTKLHEEVLTGTPKEVAASLSVRKGEITLIVGPPEKNSAPAASEIDAALVIALETMAPGKAAAAVAKSLNLSRQDLYARANALRQKPDDDI